MNDLGLLETAFGKLKFIYLHRDNLVAQAISLYRAQQTGYWHVHEGRPPERPPEFNFGAIDALVSTLRQDNLAWQSWFRDVGVEPMLIRYEDFTRDSQGITSEVLRFLNVEMPLNVELHASNKRLADEMTTVWLAQYEKELKGRNR